MNRLHDALEICLQALDAGQSEEDVLARWPGLRAELGPILRAALAARAARRPVVPTDASRRGRARILQRAAMMREALVRRPPRLIPGLPRVAIALGLVVVLALSSTGLVSASTGALPGDQLYGIKRSWEGMQLLLVYRPQEHRLLESHLEQERLDEIGELLAKGQAAPITFSGLLMKQQDGTWLVSGIPVSITGSTRMPSGSVAKGSPVVIVGVTNLSGVVEAEDVQLLQAGVALPPLEPSEPEGHTLAGGLQRQAGTAPEEQESEHHTFAFSGTVEAIGEPAWRINGQSVYVDRAGIVGIVRVGSDVNFEGYYSADGRFIVTKIEAVPTGGHKDSASEKDPASKPGDTSPGDGAGGDDGAGGEAGD